MNRAALVGEQGRPNAEVELVNLTHHLTRGVKLPLAGGIGDDRTPVRLS